VTVVGRAAQYPVSGFRPLIIHWVHIGEQTVAWGGRQLSLDPDGYLILNRADLLVLQSSREPLAQALSIRFPAAEVAQLMRRRGRVLRLLSELSPCETRFAFTEYVRSIDSALGTRLHKCMKAGAQDISAEERESLLLDALAEEVDLRRRAQCIPAIKPSTRTELLTKILQAGDFLMSHPGLSSSMWEVASLADLSPYYFSRLFKLVYGVPPHAFRSRKRIRTAKRRIAMGTRAVIAAEVGFGHRTTLFRQIRNSNPRAGNGLQVGSETCGSLREPGGNPAEDLS
jgi:AraC-like DNA-binding protein